MIAFRFRLLVTFWGAVILVNARILKPVDMLTITINGSPLRKTFCARGTERRVTAIGRVGKTIAMNDARLQAIVPKTK